MDYKEWEPWYNTILDDFSFSLQDDQISAVLLSEILEQIDYLNIDDLKKKFNFKKAVVFGAGPSLKEHIAKSKEKFKDHIFIAADGATTALLEEKIIPDIIVTDLDGKIDDILFANNKGSIVVIHAHGDNKEAIKKYTTFFDNIIGTCQCQSILNLYNFGGFSDGDRAIFLAVELGCNHITLAGMDFGDIVTKYSRPNNLKELEKADEIKKKKLSYAEKLTKWVENNEDVEIVNLKD